MNIIISSIISNVVKCMKCFHSFWTIHISSVKSNVNLTIFRFKRLKKSLKIEKKVSFGVLKNFISFVFVSELAAFWPDMRDKIQTDLGQIEKIFPLFPASESVENLTSSRWATVMSDVRAYFLTDFHIARLCNVISHQTLYWLSTECMQKIGVLWRWCLSAKDKQQSLIYMIHERIA